MLKGWGEAFSGFGWFLGVAAIAAAFSIAAWAYNPAQEAADHIGEPVAQELGIIEGKCPPDFRYDPPAGEGAVDARCLKGDLVVHLYPNSNHANYGLQTADPFGKPIPCLSIPGWPRERCE